MTIRLYIVFSSHLTEILPPLKLCSMQFFNIFPSASTSHSLSAFTFDFFSYERSNSIPLMSSGISISEYASSITFPISIFSISKSTISASSLDILSNVVICHFIFSASVVSSITKSILLSYVISSSLKKFNIRFIEVSGVFI